MQNQEEERQIIEAKCDLDLIQDSILALRQRLPGWVLETPIIRNRILALATDAMALNKEISRIVKHGNATDH